MTGGASGSRSQTATDPAVGAAIEYALLDRDGRIVAVNEAWERFALDNGGDLRRTGVGSSYLDACRSAPDDPGSQAVAAAVRSALAGAVLSPLELVVPCDSPSEPRTYCVLVSSRLDDSGECVGATVTLSRTTTPVPPAPPLPRPAPPPPSEITFPDGPKTELERVVRELTVRAQDVLAAQGRLRHLLRANAAIVGLLELPDVLRHIVDAARDLGQARYAALGVVGSDGFLEQFVHTGMTPETIERIGRLPTGQGILGLLINDPEPVRLDDLREHPAAVGFPPNHPPMGSFLGVPIRVRDEVFGNLYLTDSEHGRFSDEDEQLLVALAATAGIAISNARLFEQTQQQGQWLSSSAQLTQDLLAGGDVPALSLVLEHAVQAASADHALITVMAEDGAAVVQVTTPTLTHLRGRGVDLETTLAGRVLREERSVLVTHYPDEFEGQDGNGPALDVGSAIGVPLIGGDGTLIGALTIARSQRRPAFTDTDRHHLAGFAGYAGVAVELDRSRVEQDLVRTVADHDRIANELHDQAIQQIFAVGMGLQGMLHALPSGDQQDRVTGYVDALDRTIVAIRKAVFDLQPSADDQPDG